MGFVSCGFVALSLTSQMLKNKQTFPNNPGNFPMLLGTKSCLRNRRLNPNLLSYTAVLGAFTLPKRWSAALAVGELVPWRKS